MDINTIGWIGNFFFISGAIYIAHKNRLGFWANAVANACYAIIGHSKDIISLTVISLIFIGLDFYGLWKWRIK